MRRLVVFMIAALLVALSAAPAFAASDYSEYDYHTLLSFDNMTGSLDAGMKFPWLFNYVQPGQSKETFSLAGEIVTGDISSTDKTTGNMLNGSFRLPTVAANLGRSAKLTLKSGSPQVVPRGNLDSDESFMIFADVSKLKLSSVYISGAVKVFDKEVSSVDEVHKARSVFFENTFDCFNNVARIGKNIAECLNGIDSINGQYFVLIEYLTVELTVVRQSVDTPEFIVSAALTLNHYDLGQWLSQYELKTNIVGSDQNLISWLINSVEAFLNFELLPNFSFGIILQLILVIGLLLWFIKLLV